MSLIKTSINNLYKFNFVVFIVPRTEIVGDTDRYVKAGSTVILRCVVRGALEPPSYIIWYHGIQQVFTESRGWQVQIDRGLPGIDGDSHSTVGSLLISSVRKKDAGNYTCCPSSSEPITVSLHVINGLFFCFLYREDVCGYSHTRYSYIK